MVSSTCGTMDERDKTVNNVGCHELEEYLDGVDSIELNMVWYRIAIYAVLTGLTLAVLSVG